MSFLMRSSCVMIKTWHHSNSYNIGEKIWKGVVLSLPKWWRQRFLGSVGFQSDVSLWPENPGIEELFRSQAYIAHQPQFILPVRYFSWLQWLSPPLLDCLHSMICFWPCFVHLSCVSPLPDKTKMQNHEGWTVLKIKSVEKWDDSQSKKRGKKWL